MLYLQVTSRRSNGERGSSKVLSDSVDHWITKLQTTQTVNLLQGNPKGNPKGILLQSNLLQGGQNPRVGDRQRDDHLTNAPYECIQRSHFEVCGTVWEEKIGVVSNDQIHRSLL